MESSEAERVHKLVVLAADTLQQLKELYPHLLRKATDDSQAEHLAQDICCLLDGRPEAVTK